MLALCLFSGSSQSETGVYKNRWGMSLVEIPAGKFQMGLEDYESALMDVPEPKENELKDELPQHLVKITENFYIGATEVTQGQWLAIMENRPGPQELWEKSQWELLPVTSVSWYMAQRFVEEISKMDKQFSYRLPTEAEWEYVARAGSEELRPVPFDDLEDYAWFINNSGDRVQRVASKKANAFGVFDMLGNVWEWVDDWYAVDTYSRLGVDLTGPATGFAKVRRGGSYHCPVHLIRPGYRAANRPETAYEVTGFRVAGLRK